MKLSSISNPDQIVSAKKAVLDGLAADGSLYMPLVIPALPIEFLRELPKKTLHEIAIEIAAALLEDEVPREILGEIVQQALSFPVPLVSLGEHCHVLELFHGPTCAFKDFGARFMARLVSYFRKDAVEDLILLTATSGDTGSAVAHGFFEVPGIRVVILYPSGKVTPLQEKQFTTLGSNITCLEILGTFDDCQRMVKQAFVDQEIRTAKTLSSANSINIARLIPQTFYYFHGAAELWRAKDVVPERQCFSVPSGNFGNLTAGLMAKRMGLPISSFVAATNSNDVVVSYLAGNEFTKTASKQTISNAMDVGDPSNFARMLSLYGNSREEMCRDVRGISSSDKQTEAAIIRVYAQTGYVLDPHTAVGMIGLETVLAEKPDLSGIVLATAHPAKFRETVDALLPQPQILPSQLASVMAKEKRSTVLPPDFAAVKELLLGLQ